MSGMNRRGMTWGLRRWLMLAEIVVCILGVCKAGINAKCSTAFTATCAMKIITCFFIRVIAEIDLEAGTLRKTVLYTPTASECPDQPPPTDLRAVLEPKATPWTTFQLCSALLTWPWTCPVTVDSPGSLDSRLNWWLSLAASTCLVGVLCWGSSLSQRRRRVDGDPVHGGWRQLQPSEVLMALMDSAPAAHTS